MLEGAKLEGSSDIFLSWQQPHSKTIARMKSLPVLDAEQQLAGIIAREDIMRALTESTRG